MSSRAEDPASAPPATLERFVTLLVREHGCHTVLLYGSRALGTATDESDWDMLGIREGGEGTRDARLVEGVFLDAFIVPERELRAAAMSHVRGGIPVLDPRGVGARLVEDVAAFLSAPPPSVPEAELAARRAWCRKMLSRVRRGGPEDVEASYRRAWLLVDLLELHFVLRRRHYLGSKESFRWLLENDPLAYRAFSAALAHGAPVSAVEALVELVLDAG